MAKRITIIQGHPDPAPERFCRAYADAYARGAGEAGHEVRRIDVASLEFSLVRSQQDFEHGSPPEAIMAAQADLAWSNHWVIVYPLWLGDVPAMLKGFLEQVFRPTFAFRYRDNGFPEKLLVGRSARIVITMGMPALAYRLYFFSHSLRSFERNVLKFSGVSPVRATLIGAVGKGFEKRAAGWLDTAAELGRNGA